MEDNQSLALDPSTEAPVGVGISKGDIAQIDFAEKVARQGDGAIGKDLGISGQLPVVMPDVFVGDTPSTVKPEQVPDNIEAIGIGQFSDRLQTQLRTTLGDRATPVPSTQLPSRVAEIGTLAQFENTLEQTASTAARTIMGTEKSDLLAGTNGNDSIFALGGDDVVIALNGNDLVRAGEGDDTVVGGGGRDFVFGDGGNDLIYGDSADGLTFGVEGNDFLDGGDGDDTIFAGGNNDIVQGGNGLDVIYGEAGGDRLNGGAGEDLLLGGLDNDNLFGGDGDDYIFGEEGNDQVNGDAGNDFIYGDDGQDRVFGGAGNDEVFGGLGSDQVLGGSGSDSLDGGDGDDVLFGVDPAVPAFGLGRGDIDKMTGGNGSDRFVLASQGRNYYDDADPGSEGRGDYGLIEDFAADGTDKIQLTGNANNYVLREVGGDLPQGVGIFAIDSRVEFPGDPVGPIRPIGPIRPFPEVPMDMMTNSLGSSLTSGEAEDDGVGPRPFGGELIGVVSNASAAQLSLTNSAQFTFA
jgi:hypothetical protein